MEINEYLLYVIPIILAFIAAQIFYYWPLLNSKQISVLVSSKSSFGTKIKTIGVDFEYEGKRYSVLDIKADHEHVIEVKTH